MYCVKSYNIKGEAIAKKAFRNSWLNNSYYTQSSPVLNVASCSKFGDCVFTYNWPPEYISMHQWTTCVAYAVLLDGGQILCHYRHVL